MSHAEAQLQPIPIRIDLDPGETHFGLDRASRVHYGKLYTIEHNSKVKPFGIVSSTSIHAFTSQFRVVWDRLSARYPTSSKTQRDLHSHPSAVQASGDNFARLPPSASLKSIGFDDAQIEEIQNIMSRGQSPKYAVTKVRAEAAKASPAQAHEVGRLVEGGKEFSAAFTQMVGEGQSGSHDDEDEDESNGEEQGSDHDD